MAAISETGQHILESTDVWDLTLPWPKTYQHIDVLKRYQKSGFTFLSLTLQDLPATYRGSLEAIAEWGQICGANSEWMTMVDDLEGIDAARQAGKLALGINIQDCAPIESDLDRLSVLRRAGVWHMLLAYQTRNLVADGCAEPADAGLSLLGRRVIKEMNRVGIVVDCAHTGYRSSMEAMELSKRPVIFSHSGAFALCRHIRNIRDDQITACAATGGVIGLVGIGSFLGDPLAKTETMFRHLDHVVTLVGADHAAIGTDFVKDMEMIWRWMDAAKEHAWRDPFGSQLYEGTCFQPEQLPSLVDMMLAHGYPENAIRGILGGNMRRVYAATLQGMP